MGQLMDGLKQIGFHRCLNIMVLADHGKPAAPPITADRRLDVGAGRCCRHGGDELQQEGDAAGAAGRRQQILGDGGTVRTRAGQRQRRSV